MRLLVVTQAADLDDPLLSFFHRWIIEFAKHCEQLHIICLKDGRHNLPGNVLVHSLGKERGRSRLKYLFRFYKYVWKLRHQYDSVFVHMNPEYIVLAGFLWRLWNKKIVLWYVHRQRSLILRVAGWFSDSICTSAKRSINLGSKKVKIVGHGIDVSLFSSQPIRAVNRKTPRIVSVGRIAYIKNLEVLIEAIARLRDSRIDATLDLIGEPIYGRDKEYKRSLRTLALSRKLEKKVIFVGSVPNNEMPERYAMYDLTINLAPTGGIDKAILEAMAAGVPVLVSNKSFKEYLGTLSEILMFAERDPDDLARKALSLFKRDDLMSVQERLRNLAHEKADVSNVVSAIMNQFYAPRD